MDTSHIIELAARLAKCPADDPNEQRREIMCKLVLALRQVPAAHRALRASASEIDRIHEQVIGALPTAARRGTAAMARAPKRLKASISGALDGRTVRELAKKGARKGAKAIGKWQRSGSVKKARSGGSKSSRRPARPASRSERSPEPVHPHVHLYRQSSLQASEHAAELDSRDDDLFGAIAQSESGEDLDEELTLMLDFDAVVTSVTLSAASNEGLVGTASSTLDWSAIDGRLQELASASADDRLDAILRSLDTAEMTLVL